ncbi:endonuclease [Legionella bononiensis]|uniref:Endonuclease n=1 Tax=Legionella bononiensis TaxID=2793102 RepID=A0ABS1WA12_9GAMM|nr:endonuclease [Legionella bononiensis]MBL7480570.1 endonuclease [Legionella bononiensis]MBL7526191.1 endonuclease [Legionella bononiensis]MBL7563314.1 endonuclease [Legionella bononiensis]
MFNGVLQRVKLISILLILPFAISFATAPLTFTTAKKIAFDLFSTHQITLYCGCKYDKEKNVDLTSCTMDTAAPITRARRVEWEHMMPASDFGRYHQCWTEKLCVNEKTGKEYKGRKCCEKIDPEFRRKEAELYNLWPAVGAVNQERSNFSFGYLENKRGYYGCEFEADKTLKIAEPPDRAKGTVARANLFMADKYQVEISPEQRELLLKWNREFPPDLWELAWAAEVANIVGYANPYIKVEQVS